LKLNVALKTIKNECSAIYSEGKAPNHILP
jgi:hypothetical protein